MKLSATLAGLLLLLPSGCSDRDGRAFMLHGVSESRGMDFVPTPRYKSRSAFVVVPRDRARALFRSLPPLVDGGFDYHRLRELNEMLDGLSAGQQQSTTFPVAYAGKEVDFQVQIFLDDPRAPEIYFFSEENLINSVDRLCVEFSDAMSRESLR